MKEIKIKYELTNDKQVIVYCTEEQFSGSAPSIWPEITENAKSLAIQDMEAQIQFFKGTMLECEMEYPSWIDEPYKFVEEENIYTESEVFKLIQKSWQDVSYPSTYYEGVSDDEDAEERFQKDLLDWFNLNKK